MIRAVYVILCAAALAVATLAYSQITAEPEKAPAGYYDIPAGFDFPADRDTLERYRAAGNVPAERAHVWNVFAGITQTSPNHGYPIFETWYSDDETFRAGPAQQDVTSLQTIHTFTASEPFHALPGAMGSQGAITPPLLSFVLYNRAAYAFIRENHLYSVAQLQKLQTSGAPDRAFPTDRTVPDFPAAAVALKTIWWPVAKDHITPLPVWDPADNPSLAAGNDYSTWPRVVGIESPELGTPAGQTKDLSFMGKAFPQAHLVGLSDFYYQAVDQETASSVMSKPETARIAQFALGRPMQAGDYLALVAVHLSTKEIEDWVWATFWWHDRPDAGQYAADRPATVKGAWRNYLMNVDYDDTLPREADGSPHIVFNPYLEAKFPSQPGGQGNGVVSNCMSCHGAASYPKMGFLPIRRGNPELPKDLAFAPDRVRTDFLWAIPDHAK